MEQVTTNTFKVKLQSSEREYSTSLSHFTHHSEEDHFFLTRYLGLPPLCEAPPDLYITAGFQNKREARHRSDGVCWFLETF